MSLIEHLDRYVVNTPFHVVQYLTHDHIDQDMAIRRLLGIVKGHFFT